MAHYFGADTADAYELAGIIIKRLFIKHEKSDSFQNPERLKAYLAESVRKEHLKSLVKKAREPRGDIPDKATEQDRIAVLAEGLDGLDLPSNLAGSDVFAWVARNLPDAHLRDPLLLRYRDGKSLRQISAELKVSKNTVDRRIDEALQYLREKFSGDHRDK